VTHHFLFKRKVIGLLFSVWFIVGVKGTAQQSEGKTEKQSYSLEITPKLHSAGYFQYSGALFNYHPNIELNVTVNCKQFGAFITKYYDLIDSHSPVNYTTVGIYRTVQINPQVKVTPYAGYFFAQKHSLMDKGSDLWAGLVTRLTISENIWVENTTLVGNLLHHSASMSVANRLNATLMIRTFRLDTYAWYAHSMHTALHGISTGLALTSPEWALSHTVSLKAQVTFLQQITQERPAGAYERGVLVSLIVPIECNKAREE
jgi:hypothetical protein